MPFNLQDRVRYTGNGARRPPDESSVAKRKGSLATIVGGPDAVAAIGRDLVRYTVRFENGDRWWVDEEDLELA